jgi:hypothetical protein
VKKWQKKRPHWALFLFCAAVYGGGKLYRQSSKKCLSAPFTFRLCVKQTIDKLK